jgi:hypothetical protein
LDKDQNPYDGDNVRVLADGTFAQNTAVTAGFIKAGTTGVRRGEYYVCAQITTAGGQTRYAYAPQILTIT